MTNGTKTVPENNPADVHSLDGLAAFLSEKILLNLQKVLPGIVQSYDRNTNRAIIQPAISAVASRGQKIQRPPLINIPVFSMSGGGIVMSFPIQAGDTGWIIAADRDISIFKQNLAESSPNTYRKHQYTDAFFLPDKINDINISEDDAGAVVISTLDGSTKFTLKSGEIKLTGNTIITGDTTITGTLTVSGDVMGAGISLSTHTHSGVEPGSGSTGGPQ